jgi:hypothetical protein
LQQARGNPRYQVRQVEVQSRRPGSRGLHFLRTDAQLLCLVYSLQAKWHPRKLEPTRAIKKIIDLLGCPLDLAVWKSLRGKGKKADEPDPDWKPAWGEPSMAKLLGCANYRQQSIDSTLRRLGRRRLFAGRFMGNSMTDLKVGAAHFSPPPEL